MEEKIDRQVTMNNSKNFKQSLSSLSENNSYPKLQSYYRDKKEFKKK